ncbi:MAG: prepilin-type N-terminal cleavage/methylation domain-containing protein [Candidatus Omnitrophica bacterium]|nr:prepilin-type N-terminal cleavage/methylation domain-containing protein [Candidatus Omnitrophota bacterium]
MRKKNRGFTFVEVMVVFFVFSVIMAAIYAVLNVGKQSWYMGITQEDVQQEARTAMEMMVRELRESRDSGVVVAAGNSRITFEMPSGTDANGDLVWDYQVQYFLGGANGDHLMRTFTDLNAGTTLANKVIAKEVNSVQFTRFPTSVVTDDPDGVPNSGDEVIENLVAIEVTLQTQKDVLQGRTMTNTLTSRAILRNE